MKVTAAAQGSVQLANTYAEDIGHVIVINVEDGVGAFEVQRDGVPAGKTLPMKVPTAYQLGIDDFAEALAKEVTSALDATGLYHDEAVAMVSTWKRQWFKTPGIRVLYLMPQSWTDASIPLNVLPAPEKTVRVMMIRTEVITGEMESSDTSYAKMLGDANPATQAGGKMHFELLGRFAEPRLRRARDPRQPGVR